MLFRKFALLIGAISIAVGSLLLLPIEARADSTPVLTKEDEAKLREKFDEYQVPRTTQDKLINKINAGQPLDSMNPAKKPTETRTLTTPAEEITVHEYADGSIAALSIERPRGKSNQDTVALESAPHSCTRSGTKRLNCTVDAWVGLVSMSFKASFDTANDKVWGATSPSWTVIGACSASLVSLKNTAYNTARMTISASACVPYTTTMYLQLQVKRGVATESWG